MKAKYPGMSVHGSIESVYYSHDYLANTDCHYTSDTYTSGQGWYTATYFVKTSYLPQYASSDAVKVCYAK